MPRLLTKHLPRLLGKMVAHLKQQPQAAGPTASPITAPTSAHKDHAFYLPYWGEQGEEKLLAINNPFRGTLVIGGVGSGKTLTLAHTFLYQAVTNGYAGILYDFKFPELAQVARMAYQAPANGKQRAKQFFVSFEHPHLSQKVNPLHPRYIQSISHAEEYARVILYNLNPESISKPDFWNKSAIALLQAAIWFFKTEHPESCNLPHVVSFLQSDTSRMLETLRTNAVCARLISSILTAHDKRAQTQLAAVIGSLQIALNAINTPEATMVLSGDEVDLHLNDPADPKLLVIGSSQQMKETYAPLISLICSVALKLMNAPHKCPSLVLLDEAPTLYIPGLEDIPATGRSRKIAVVYMAQDISQITDKYGKQKKDALLATLSNQFYGRVVQLETAEYVSQLFGRTEKIAVSITSNTPGDLNKEKGHSAHYQVKDHVKLTPRSILEFPSGCFASIVPETDEGTAQLMVRTYAPMQIAHPNDGFFAEKGVVLGTEQMENINQEIAMNVLVAAPTRAPKKTSAKQARLKF